MKFDELDLRHSSSMLYKQNAIIDSAEELNAFMLSYEEDQKAISGLLNIFNSKISWQDE